jgi:hypothetical protein
LKQIFVSPASGSFCYDLRPNLVVVDATDAHLVVANVVSHHIKVVKCSTKAFDVTKLASSMPLATGIPARRGFAIFLTLASLTLEMTRSALRCHLRLGQSNDGLAAR